MRTILFTLVLCLIGGLFGADTRPNVTFAIDRPAGDYDSPPISLITPTT